MSTELARVHSIKLFVNIWLVCTLIDPITKLTYQNKLVSILQKIKQSGANSLLLPFVNLIIKLDLFSSYWLAWSDREFHQFFWKPSFFNECTSRKVTKIVCLCFKLWSSWLHRTFNSTDNEVILSNSRLSPKD